MGLDGIQRDGIRWNTQGWDYMEYKGMGLDGIQRDGMEYKGMVLDEIQ